ncbi:MAG: TRAP transporter substrate-binding protein [Pirellulaceae bacterium]|nr:TRAP transporter substrate-binding protein [Pirellulaceae bacterium]
MLRMQRLFFVLGCLLLLPACERADRPLVFAYSNEQPIGSLRSQSMLFFKEQLEQQTDGRIQVELYFGGVLGTERELMDLVATGALQGTRGGFFADANPKYMLLTLPFLVDGWDQAITLVNSDFMKELNQGARERGWHIPATGISQGFRAHTNNVRPITHPDDLAGLKMRVPPQEVFVQTALAFGANPQEIPAVEIYQALQMGVVDGQDNPPSNIWDYKVFEVSKFMTITNYATGPDPMLVNLDWYESLPTDLQQIFDRVAREAIAYSDQLNRKQEEEFINKLSQKLAVNQVAGSELLPFREAVKPVYDYYVQKGDLTWEEVERARQAARGE